MVEQADESFILLAVDVAQFNGHIVGHGQRFGAKEVGSSVIIGQQTFVFGRHHGRQLLQVANHEQLHATKRPVMVAIAAQHRVDSVKQVATYHTDFVDNQQIERADNLALLFAEVVSTLHLHARNEGRKRQLKEAMNGDSARVDGSNACRCHNHHAFGAVAADGFEEGSLTCSGLSRQENALSGMLHEVPGLAELFVLFHIDHIK